MASEDPHSEANHPHTPSFALESLPQPLATSYQRALDPRRSPLDRLQSIFCACFCAMRLHAILQMAAHLQAEPHNAVLRAYLGLLQNPTPDTWRKIIERLCQHPARRSATLARELQKSGNMFLTTSLEGHPLEQCLQTLRQRVAQQGQTWGEKTLKRQMEYGLTLLNATLTALPALAQIDLLVRTGERETVTYNGLSPSSKTTPIQSAHLLALFRSTTIVAQHRVEGSLAPLGTFALHQKHHSNPIILLLDHWTPQSCAYINAETIAWRDRVSLTDWLAAPDPRQTQTRERDTIAARLKAWTSFHQSRLTHTRYHPARYLARSRTERAIRNFFREGRETICILSGEAGSGRSALLCHLTRWLQDQEDAGVVLLDLETDARASITARIWRAIGLDEEPASEDALQLLLNTWGDTGGCLHILMDLDLSAQPRALLQNLDKFALALHKANERAQRPWIKLLLATQTPALQSFLGGWTRNSEYPHFGNAFCFVHHEDPATQQKKPYLSLPLFEDAEAGRLYAWSSHANDESCPIPWEKLSDTTRYILQRPLYISIFHKAFSGQARASLTHEDDLWDAYTTRLLSRGRQAPALKRAIYAFAETLLTRDQRTSHHQDFHRKSRETWYEENQNNPEKLSLSNSPFELLLNAQLIRRGSWDWEAHHHTIGARLVERCFLDKHHQNAEKALAGLKEQPPSEIRDSALAILTARIWRRDFNRALSLHTSSDIDLLARCLLRAFRSAHNNAQDINKVRAGIQTIASRRTDPEDLSAWKDALLWSIIPGIHAPFVLRPLLENAASLCDQLHQHDPDRARHMRDLSIACGKLAALDPGTRQGQNWLQREEEAELLLAQMGPVSFVSNQEDRPTGRIRALARSYKAMGDMLQRHLKSLEKDSEDHFLALAQKYQERGEKGLKTGSSRTRSWFNKSRILREELLLSFPNNLEHLTQLGGLYQKLAALDRSTNPLASVHWTRLQTQNAETMTALHPEHAPYLQHQAASYNNLGDLLQLTEPGTARENYLAALQVRQKLADLYPGDVTALQALSNSFHRLGKHDSKHNPAEARVWFEHDLSLCAQLALLIPGDRGLLRNLSVAYYRLGEQEQKFENLPRAQELFEKDAEIALELVRRNPRDLRGLRDLLSTYQKLAHLASGDAPPKRAERTESELWVLRHLTALAPDDPRLQTAVLGLHQRFQTLQFAIGQERTARWFKQHLSVLDLLTQAAPGHEDILGETVACCAWLGEFYLSQPNPQNARTWLTRGLEAQQNLLQKGNEDHLEHAIGIYTHLAHLDRTEDLDRADQWLRKLHRTLQRLQELHPDRILYHWKMAEACDALCALCAQRIPHETIIWLRKTMKARNAVLPFLSSPGSTLQTYESLRHELRHPEGFEHFKTWLQAAQRALEQLITADRKNLSFQRDLAICQTVQADIELRHGRNEDARKLLNKALARLQRQVSVHADEATLWNDLSSIYKRLETLDRDLNPHQLSGWKEKRQNAQERAQHLQGEPPSA